MQERDRTPRGEARGLVRARGGTSRAAVGVATRLSHLASAFVVSLLAACGLCAPAFASVPAGASTPAPAAAHAMGLLPITSPVASAVGAARAHAAAVALPASVDLTPYAMPVGNQGNVGSCAAWATDYAALGYWINKQKLAGGALAPMYTYSQVDGGWDDGSTIEGNLYLDEQQGIDNQGDYWQGNYDYSDVPSSAEMARAVNWKLTGFQGLVLGPTLTQQSIQAALASGDPVVIGIPVYDNFFYVTSANNGLYSAVSGSLDGYHAVAALGYTSTGLRIENSWGTGWGAAGYSTLSWSFVSKYVFDAVAVGPLATGQPVGAAAPTIAGTARQGLTLTASAGSWSPSATSVSYQWERAVSGSSKWTAIAGAMAATYVPAAADVGESLRVLVTATATSGRGAATSIGTATVPAGAPSGTAAPSVSGALRAGQTLTASPGKWSPSATSYAYQWQRSTNGTASWSNIAGATSTSYVSGAADVNASLRVLVTAANNNGQSTAPSAQVGPISGLPYNTAVPAVTGTATRGLVLTAGAGSWSPAASSYAYQWQRSTNAGATWTSIAGVSGSSYTLAVADESAEIRVLVTAINPYGQTVAASAPTGLVKASPPANTTIPTISGNAVMGATLTGNPGAWNPAGPAFVYQGQRGSAARGYQNIAGASAPTYKLQSADVGQSVRLIVTAGNVDGSTSETTIATQTVSQSSTASK